MKAVWNTTTGTSAIHAVDSPAPVASAVGTSIVYISANWTSAEATAARGSTARGKATFRTSVPLSAIELVAAASALAKNIQGRSPLSRNSGKRSIGTRTTYRKASVYTATMTSGCSSDHATPRREPLYLTVRSRWTRPRSRPR